MENKNKKKTSQLVFDMKQTRRLLKLNGEWKYCPFCGKELKENCDCHKNLIIDVKHKRDTTNETIAVFYNNEQFQADYEAIFTELKKKDSEPEQLSFDFGD